MDVQEFVLGVLIVMVTGILIGSWIRMKSGIAQQKLAEELRVSAEKRKYAMMKAKNSRTEQIVQDDISPWVGELLSSFGVSPEVLFEDQMPPELAKLIPLAKGFIQGGGLQKLLGGSPDQAQLDAEQHRAI